VDRIELVDQTAYHLRALGLQTGILQADNTWLRREDEVVVASIQTIGARSAPPSGFVVIDECHILQQAHIEFLFAGCRQSLLGVCRRVDRRNLTTSPPQNRT
jgi:hypothetical protein